MHEGEIDPRPAVAPRHHGLDYLRATMIIIVVIAHVSQAYVPVPKAEHLASAADIGERYLDPDRTVLAAWIHPLARMIVNPMLFLLAGFSWAFLLKRRSLRSIAWNRTTRILIPLVIGWFIAFPLVRYAFAIGRELMLSADGDASLATAFMATPITPYLPFASDVFYLAHFWFLYYLLLFYLASLAIAVVFARPAEPWRRDLRALQARTLVGDLRWMRWPLLVTLTFLTTIPDRTPELEISHGLLPELETFAAHYAFFLVGWLFALHPEILGDLDRRAGGRFLFGLLLAILLVIPMGANHMDATTPADRWLESRPLQLGIYWLLHAIAIWAIVPGMLGLAVRWFPRVDPRFAYVAEASFWIYIAHLPFAVFVPVLLHNWSLDADLKMWLASAIVLVICVASYHFLVRDTVIGRGLAGRYRRSIVPRSPTAPRTRTD